MHTIFPTKTTQDKPDPATRIPLYCSPRYTSLTFAPVTSGTDLYAHRGPDGAVSLWLWHWSDVPGEACVPSCVTEEFAARFIQELFFDSPFVGGLEHANLVKCLPHLYWAAKRKGGE
jgi:hypothetical protein